jgi:hypothetical protein
MNEREKIEKELLDKWSKKSKGFGEEWDTIEDAFGEDDCPFTLEDVRTLVSFAAEKILKEREDWEKRMNIIIKNKCPSIVDLAKLEKSGEVNKKQKIERELSKKYNKKFISDMDNFSKQSSKIILDVRNEIIEKATLAERKRILRWIKDREYSPQSSVYADNCCWDCGTNYIITIKELAEIEKEAVKE